MGAIGKKLRQNLAISFFMGDHLVPTWPAFWQPFWKNTSAWGHSPGRVPIVEKNYFGVFEMAFNLLANFCMVAILAAILKKVCKDICEVEQIL